MTDTLGDRIKRYEAVSKYSLTPRSPLFIRVDGKSFHTFTKGCDKPFDKDIMNCMVYAAKETAKQMSGFKLAYIQSDEATFMLTDTDTLTTQGWFDYELNKLVSISASAFTAHFNWYWHVRLDHNFETALFDSRAFTVPIEDAPNVFIWRQRDWERNAVQMLARAHFSHKQCSHKKIPELLAMCEGIGASWDDLTPREKYGTFILKNGQEYYDKVMYENLKEMIGAEG